MAVDLVQQSDECLNHESQRRADSVDIFQNKDAIIRRVGDVLAEQIDQ